MKYIHSIPSAMLVGGLIAATSLNAQSGNFEPSFDAETRAVGGSAIQVTADYWYRINSASAPKGEEGVINEVSGDNNANLWGAGIGYAINSQWSLDFSYLRGSSSFEYISTYPARPGVEIINTPDSKVSWYEFRVRYTPATMVERAVQAYFAGGITHIRSEDRTHSTVFVNDQIFVHPDPQVGRLENKLSIDGEGRSLFAMAGAGLGGVIPGQRLFFGYKLEASVLYGRFKTENTVIDFIGGGTEFVRSSENTWGINGQAGAFVMVPLNDAHTAQFLLEGGARLYYWDLDAGSQTSWGPYIKAGVSFQF